MALVRTTLSSAVAAGDSSIAVVSATSITAGRILRIDDEWFIVQKDYSSGTTIPVRGGQFGSARTAHVASAGVVHGTAADDFDSPGAGVTTNSPTAGRARYIKSYTADNSTASYGPAGSDTVVILNGSAAITITFPVPTKDMDGDMLYVVMDDGSAAHELTFTGGLGGAGSGYTVVTTNGTAGVALQAIACNGLWNPFTAPAMGGTVTAIIGSIA